MREEQLWRVEEKAQDLERGQLRSPSLSDPMAQVYWNRALLLVTEVDRQRGGPKYQSMFQDLQNGYLTINELRFYMVQCVAVSKAYLDTLKRTFKALVHAFVWPKLTDEQWFRYEREFQNIRREAGAKATEIAPKIGAKGSLWVPDPARPSGGHFVARPEPALETIVGSLGSLASLERAVAELVYRAAAVAQKRRRKPAKKKKKNLRQKLAKVQLQLAEAKSALLAGYLALWTCERRAASFFLRAPVFLNFWIVIHITIWIGARRSWSWTAQKACHAASPKVVRSRGRPAAAVATFVHQRPGAVAWRGVVRVTWPSSCR